MFTPMYDLDLDLPGQDQPPSEIWVHKAGLRRGLSSQRPIVGVANSNWHGKTQCQWFCYYD